jgi:hypothetical protein
MGGLWTLRASQLPDIPTSMALEQADHLRRIDP